MAGGRLTDWISLGVLASWVPADAVDDAIEAAGKQARRRGGKLPPRVTAYLVMALALFADEDYEEVAARLAGTLADWDGWEESWGRVPTSGGIAQARQRLGPKAMAELFTRAARPVATVDTAGAFLGRWRLMSIDGMAWDIPDTPANAAAFGYPRAGKDGSPGAFPKAQVVTVSECASHAAVLAAIGPFALKAGGERALARQLYPELEEDWLLIADRGFYDWPDWCTAADTGAALLWRFKSDIRLPVLEILPDGSYRSVLVTPKAKAAARQELVEAARAGEELDPARARHVRVIEYEIPDRDGQDELIALVTTITDPLEAPGGRPRGGLPPKMGTRDRQRPAQDLPPGPGQGTAVAVPGHDRAGDLGLPPGPLRDQRPDLHRCDQRGHRPGPGEVQKNDPRRPPPGRRPGFSPLTSASASWPGSPKTSPAART